MNITEDTFIALVTGNSKSSFVPGNGTKTKHVFLIIDHNSTVLMVTLSVRSLKGCFPKPNMLTSFIQKAFIKHLLCDKHHTHPDRNNFLKC